MARFEPVVEWPGAMLYRAIHGRVYCAMPRGLIPEYPYTVATLRQPTAMEQQAWGPGVLPRMVVDVTNHGNLAGALRAGSLHVAPWSAYLVLRLPENLVIVAYRIGPGAIPLDRQSAGQVAIGSGHDVAGWSAEVIRHFQGERWHFTPPSLQAFTPIQPSKRVFSGNN
ncbi:MAG TPA: hypothetical protein VNL71_08635 [Chloroflexota bacterium]|nr:hypothetical protein [Chloroflexota bacterium]